MAMLKNKHIAFSLILMCLIVVSPMAKAQLGGLLGGLLTGLTSIVNVQGVVFCSVNGTVSTSNVTAIPPFPNAGVTLRCLGQTVSTTTTNAAGVFSFTNVLTNLLTTLLSGGCRVVVTTPLVNCDAGLPTTGGLSAPLSLLGAASTGVGGVNIIDLVPALPFVPFN